MRANVKEWGNLAPIFWFIGLTGFDPNKLNRYNMYFVCGVGSFTCKGVYLCIEVVL